MLASHGACLNMNSQQHPLAAAQVAEKVMRRVEIAKVPFCPASVRVCSRNHADLDHRLLETSRTA
jgi:hypothetical protein